MALEYFGGVDKFSSGFFLFDPPPAKMSSSRSDLRDPRFSRYSNSKYFQYKKIIQFDTNRIFILKFYKRNF